VRFKINGEATTTPTDQETAERSDSTGPLEEPWVGETRLTEHTDRVVLTSVEDTLIGLIDAETDSICQGRATSARPIRLAHRLAKTPASSDRTPVIGGCEYSGWPVCHLRRRPSKTVGAGSRRRIVGRQLGVDAGRAEATMHLEHEMGHAGLLGSGATAQPGEAGSGGGLGPTGPPQKTVRMIRCATSSLNPTCATHAPRLSALPLSCRRLIHRRAMPLSSRRRACPVSPAHRPATGWRSRPAGR